MEQSIPNTRGYLADAPVEKENNAVSAGTIWQVITA